MGSVESVFWKKTEGGRIPKATSLKDIMSKSLIIG